ncbi:amidohydrolase [Candidatus Poribacteria bacterium]|nr:amidohydrolase [Candidatus Poribacteria bacterium]MBT7099871.1 amidohydrolase [Candidatus Poribacteria bacterium]MBT7804473.1 amidohydrolase [Candidatus Poribacteria bacterium]
MRIIDPHLHVWGDGAEFPFAEGRTPTARADTNFLIECMDAAGVAGALIIQPIVYRFDHRYVSGALRDEPGRFKGMCLVDPQHADPVGELARWRDEGYIAVRVNPGLFPDGQGLGSDLGHQLYAAAGDLGMRVGFLVSPSHFDAIDALCQASPETVAVIDHFGHCRSSAGENAEFEDLVALSRHPNLHVKLSQFPRASRVDWPYADLHPWISRLLDAYGAERLMWATDFPFIVEQCGYTEGLTLFTEHAPGIEHETMQQLLAGTAEAVFGPWSG